MKYSIFSKFPINSKDEIDDRAIVKKMKQQNVKAAYDYDNELRTDKRS